MVKMVIFIDTGYVLALINTSDKCRERASAIAPEIVDRFVITEAVPNRDLVIRSPDCADDPPL